MIPRPIPALIIFLSSFLNIAFAQDSSINKKISDSIALATNKPANLTIVYDITVKTDKEKAGIEETYNGGVKTVFIDNDKARIRLVSLMRIESIFFEPSTNPSKTVEIVKESGKKKYKYNLSDSDWSLYNKKYIDDSCQFTNDSSVILDYQCRKVIIALKDGRNIMAYYTDKLGLKDAKIEPAFKCIPGVVLQYEYDYKKGSVQYTANKISQNPIDSRIFKIPGKGYIVKKYCSKCSSKQLVPVASEIN